MGLVGLTFNLNEGRFTLYPLIYIPRILLMFVLILNVKFHSSVSF